MRIFYFEFSTFLWLVMLNIKFLSKNLCMGQFYESYDCSAYTEYKQTKIFSKLGNKKIYI